MIVEAVFLEQIDDVKLIGDPWTHLLHPEVIPLGVTAGVKVGL